MRTEPTVERVTAAAEGDVVVFLVGMRVNRWRAVRHWLPTLVAMPRMLKELSADPDSGLLGYRMLSAGPRAPMVVQYWESREKLLAYASASDKRHRPARAAFNRRARGSGGNMGVWHEMYLVPAGSYETLYGGMPPVGLGAAYGTEPVRRRGERAAERLGAPTARPA
ncbi:DUF4188 domain-containing protein [Streptomyces sp. ISL-11]|uniref:DUF4188 domain-containing protein n=1 Tax=Streptomyces sp. ISL-11 TaxID=2819174 RepID=UPI001BE50851|nr:DUF4188 domain-containing protein [Streptomyces sp. ISL-11]MBT2387097.1 DUF4188 domain-containing protein [Streptomyces sp. ISL-11]